jgi:hypothetical protein
LPSVQQALLHVTGKMGLSPDLIIPTQQRYLDYLSTMLAGKKPNSKPVLLERVLMNGIPKMGDGNGSNEACRPYLQIFKDARLIYTSTGRDTANSSELRWYTGADSCVLFPVGLELEGDILVRVRHLSADNKRVSMLRFGFHTGFINTPGNTRFLKSQLDGAYTDPRFPSSFFIDLVFRPAEEPDPATEEGKAKIDTQKQQIQWWEQVNSARRQAAPSSRAEQLAVPAAADAAEAEANAAIGSPTAATVSSSDTGGVNNALVTPAKSKPTFGSLFSSATSKLGTLNIGGALGGLSLFGADSSSVRAGDESSAASASHLDLSNPEVARLHAADEAALRKARRRAATEAAVAAALQLSPSARAAGNVRGPSSSASNTAAAAASTAADTDSSFADLQAYVQGLGALDAQQLEVDSDDEAGSAHSPAAAAAATAAVPAVIAAIAAASPSAAAAQRDDDLDLDRAMQQHFSEEDNARAAAAATGASKTTGVTVAPVVAQSEDDLFASLGLPTTPMKDPSTAAAVTATAPASADDDLDAAAAASLEAELAMLSAGDLDGGGLTDDGGLGGDGEEVVLDDADEAALLASLQDELGAD